MNRCYAFESTDTAPDVCRVFLSEECIYALKISSKEEKTVGFIEYFPPFSAHTSPAGKLHCSQRTDCQITEDGERKCFGSSVHLL